MSEQIVPVNNVVPLHPDSDDDLLLIPPTIYQVTYIRHETLPMFNKRRKLRVLFRIVSPGPGFGRVIERWYQITSTEGRVRAARRSHLARDMRSVFGRSWRPDRSSVAGLKGLLLTARVRTVTKDHEQRPYNDRNTYSVIDEIIGEVQP